MTRRTRTLLVCVLSALVLRVVYGLEMRGDALLSLDRLDQTDMAYYDGWGRAIAAGDWRSSSVGAPMHDWQRDVAERYLAEHPGRREALAREAGVSIDAFDADAALWAQWTPVHQFYQDPLYPYALAAVYWSVGHHTAVVYALQMAAGIGAVVFVVLVTRRYFGDAEAAVAGALAVLSPVLLYYDLVLLRESFIACTAICLVWLCGEAIARRDVRWFGAAGAACGVAILLKASFALFALLFLTGLVVTLWRERSILSRYAVAFAVGLFVALIPLAVRNLSLGVPAWALASTGPLTFATGNDVASLAAAGFTIDRDRLGDELAAGDGRMLPTVRATLAFHSPSSFASMIWRKWSETWHWYEIPNNENFYYARVRAPVLAWMPATFFVLSPLVLVGVVLAWPYRAQAWPLFAMIATTGSMLMVFFVLGRFRAEMLTSVLPIAALPVVAIGRAFSARRFARVAVLAGAILAIGLWTGRDRGPDEALIQSEDWLTPYYVTYKAEVQDATARGDQAGVANALLGFFRSAPTLEQVGEQGDPGLAASLALLHEDCARALDATGRHAEAMQQVSTANDLRRLTR